MVITFKYKDETDRAYGLGGMMACMCLLENEDFVKSVSLDAAPDEGVIFTPDFFQMSNQRLSAKSVWKEDLNHFELMASMLVANVLSRVLVRHREDVTTQLSDLMLSRLTEEGRKSCTLGYDEVKDIYYKTYGYFHRVFTHPEVMPVVSSFAEDLLKERSMDSDRILLCFRPLLRR